MISLCILHMWRKHQIFPSVHLYLQQIDFTTFSDVKCQGPYKNVCQSLLSLKMYLSKQCGGMWSLKVPERRKKPSGKWKKDFRTSINQSWGTPVCRTPCFVLSGHWRLNVLGTWSLSSGASNPSESLGGPASWGNIQVCKRTLSNMH